MKAQRDGPALPGRDVGVAAPGDRVAQRIDFDLVGKAEAGQRFLGRVEQFDPNRARAVRIGGLDRALMFNSSRLPVKASGTVVSRPPSAGPSTETKRSNGQMARPIEPVYLVLRVGSSAR